MRQIECDELPLHLPLWQQMLLQLAHCVAGELFYRQKSTRHFERRELLSAFGFERCGIEGSVRNDVGYGNFAAKTIRYANDGYLFYAL